jgi:hypothetical protein
VKATPWVLADPGSLLIVRPSLQPVRRKRDQVSASFLPSDCPEATAWLRGILDASHSNFLIIGYATKFKGWLAEREVLGSNILHFGPPFASANSKI